MLHSSNTTHKVLCCTIPNTFQGLLLVFLPWRGLFFYVHEWQRHFSRHFERISCSLPFCWAGYRRSTRFSAEEQGVFVYSSQPTPLPLTFSHSAQDGVKPVYDSCCGKMGQFLHPTEACAATRAGLAPLQKPVAAGGGWAGGLSQRQCQLQALAKLWP